MDLIASSKNVLEEQKRLVSVVQQTIIDINQINRVHKNIAKYSIGIITARSRQYKDLYSMLKSVFFHIVSWSLKLFFRSRNLRSENVTIRSIDHMGGLEKDIIILVAASSEEKQHVKHHALWQHNNEKQHYIALSKAKHCLIVVGAIKELTNDYWWSKLLRDGEVRGIIHQIEPDQESFESILKK